MTRPGHHLSDDDHAAYLLGALEPAEAGAHEDHLASCEGCRARLEWYAPAAELLPASVDQLEPPPELRRRILDAVTADAASERAGESGIDFHASRLGRWRAQWRPMAVAALAALAAATMTAAIAVFLSGTGGSGQTTVAARPTNAAPPGMVSATLEREGGMATLHVERLPKLSAGKVYETWIQRGKVLEPGTVFVLRRDGTADAAVPGPLAGADAVLVTREPTGGTKSPTSPPLLKARL